MVWTYEEDGEKNLVQIMRTDSSKIRRGRLKNKVQTWVEEGLLKRTYLAGPQQMAKRCKEAGLVMNKYHCISVCSQN